MSRLIQLYRTTLGKKAVVAVTGIILFGFVALHMLGNLKTFVGADPGGAPAIDTYAHFLRTMGEPLLPHGFALWTMRIILVIALVLHVWTSIHLAHHNRSARLDRYVRENQTESTLAARTMVGSGVLLLVFVVIHVLQFTTGTIDITPIVPETVYANLYHAFREWLIVLLYIAAMALLAVHLYHGAWSLFQTLGLDNPDRNRALRVFASVSAVVLFLGFCSVPVLFLLGVMPGSPDPGSTPQPLGGR